MTKENKIKEAYGEYWGKVKDYVNENGWCSIRRGVGFNEIVKNLSWETRIGNQYCWRPKSLQGIENNNGWIKIESEADLPEYGYYEVIKRATGEHLRASLNNEFRTASLAHYYSHYKPIVKIDLPLY